MKKLIIFFIVISSVSCISSKRSLNADIDSRSITYNKVKLKLETKDFGNIPSLKGYISLFKDSMLCFKFYGPLAFEVVSGYFKDKFVVQDHINNTLHKDVLQKVGSSSGILVNRKVFEAFIIGDVSALMYELNFLNKGVVDIMQTSNKRRHILILNKARNSRINLLYKYDERIPKSIELKYEDNSDRWNIKIEVINVTNEQRKCNFEF